MNVTPDIERDATWRPSERGLVRLLGFIFRWSRRPIGDVATLHEDREADFLGRGGRGWTGADCDNEVVTIGDEGWRVVDLWDGEAMTAALMIKRAIVVCSEQTGRVDDTA